MPKRSQPRLTWNQRLSERRSDREKAQALSGAQTRVTARGELSSDATMSWMRRWSYRQTQPSRRAFGLRTKDTRAEAWLWLEAHSSSELSGSCRVKRWQRQ